ncbi:MAG: bi-domain-containing oxidoreductase [Chitinophagaceae bacterium]|jgi:polar amino acid transport system substrate-binding protein|nr:bi-domain-containing oxidoreductase [Chitinophagaceae bacterium]OQY93776.1 MAG: oxidoreductase [Sphingobacteriales bacterium UTBCD1]
MKQVVQNFKTGELYVDEVPLPSLSPGLVLVENEYSLISAGTERGTVKVAKANLLGKAKQRPDLVAQVLRNIKKEGIRATIQKIKTKLDSLKAMGYSTAGTVLASMDKNGKFKKGDRVACGGQDFASHAEIVAIPQNLVVKIPDNVSTAEASFTTLGAIALQGVRQAEINLGDNVCVIGLGLIGQITCQLLKASGCNVFGIDLSDKLVSLAKELSADKAMNRSQENVLTACENFTNGHGFDSVIITAAAPSNDPVEFASEILRKKGKLVIVGAVKMDIPRDPHFYRKELELKMSCSYGPGRYDVNYEELGNDYPYPYVRWTEQRNMEAFLELLSKKRINLNPLITHTFDITEAETAYDIVIGKVAEPHIGILLKYPARPEKFISTVALKAEPLQKINVGFIGAGSFAQSYLIPNVKTFGAGLSTVVTSRGITSKNVAAKFGFNYCSTEINDIFREKNINTVFIATPHTLHAAQVTESLKAGKNVFVEKPLATDLEGLKKIIEVKKNHNNPLMVGFNRRFASCSEFLKKEFADSGEPLVINIRINAGLIPKTNWIQMEELGGGRIIGEMCHFVDLFQFFSGSEPVDVYARRISTDNDKITPNDNLAIIVSLRDGSVGNLTYLSNGDTSLPKEHIEIFGAGKAGVIHDFKKAEVYKKGKKIQVNQSGKGHKQEVELFLKNILEGKDAPIGFKSICLTTLTTFKVIDSLNTSLPQQINVDELF